MRRPALLLALWLVSIFGFTSTANACIAVLQCTCSVSAPTVAFGNYSPITSANIDVSPNLQVTCSSFVASVAFSYEVRLSAGSSGVFTARQMKNGSSSLSYNLFRNSSRTLVWGDGATGTSTVSSAFTLLAIGTQVDSFPIYARAYGGQNLPAGAYSDTITATIVY